MSIVPDLPVRQKNDYPTSDGKPMAETDWHRILMNDLIETLDEYFAAQPRVYVSGNLLLFYEQGDRRRHVSPDVFVVRGVEKALRPNYLLWEEGKGPEVVVALTSSSTRREDQGVKRALYQDKLKVKEYFLFDPDADWLDPPMQGYRLRAGVFQPIRPRQRRLPSQVLGLHLERDGRALRLWNPETGQWLPTPRELRHLLQDRIAEVKEFADRAAVAQQQAEDRAQKADEDRTMAEDRAARAEAEIERLRRLLEQTTPPAGTP